MRYLRETANLPLTLEADPTNTIHWWADASFAVHPDMKSHTGAVLSLGRGAVYTMSTRQKLNTKSSTEAELVAVDDAMPNVAWTRNFLIAQGIIIPDTVIYQDNQSAILLERNGQKSSGKRTRHLDIRYYYVTDCISKKELRIEYCPTAEMLADILTKPLQGSLFRQLRDRLLNIQSFQYDSPSSDLQECVGAPDTLDTHSTHDTDTTVWQTDHDDSQPLNNGEEHQEWILVKGRKSKPKEQPHGLREDQLPSHSCLQVLSY
jgi:hypothetical protein